MKKLLAFVLMATLCLLPMVFSACIVDTSVMSAEEMLPHCDDTILTDTLTGVDAIELSADLYAVAFHNIPGDKVTIDYTTNEKTTITATVVANKLVITQTCKPLTIHIGSMGTKLCLVVGIPESWTGYSIDADVDFQHFVACANLVFDVATAQFYIHQDGVLRLVAMDFATDGACVTFRVDCLIVGNFKIDSACVGGKVDVLNVHVYHDSTCVGIHDNCVCRAIQLGCACVDVNI